MTRENVILITADGLRYDRLSHTGNDTETTPTLDELAESGAVCDQAIVTGTATRKSFPGILTSSYPLMYGGFAKLTDHRTPLSSVFQDHDYVTLGVNANAQLHTRFGWDRGFDAFYDSDTTTINTPVGDFRASSDEESDDRSTFSSWFDDLKSSAYERLDQEGLPYQILEKVYRQLEARKPPYPRAPEIVDLTLSFLDRAPDDQPFFLWVHFMETHSPYVPPVEYRSAVDAPDVSTGEMWRLNDRLHTNPASLSDDEVAVISDLYDASLRFLDDEIGRLFNGLSDRGLWADSRVMFTSDHGEQFREHGKLTHCLEPYEEGAHVPLIAKFGDEELQDVQKAVSTIDIGPTLLDATFDEPDVPDNFHGRSLCPEFMGDDVIPEDRVVYCQNTSNTDREIRLDLRITGCRSSDWKYITSRDERLEDKLFYLPSDSDEQDNVVASEPRTARRFEELVESHYQQDAYTKFKIAEASGTGRVTDRLEALGYVTD